MQEHNTVVDRILETLLEKKMTKSELAVKCEWPMSKISKVLKGDQKISTDDLITIAMALDMNPALLIVSNINDVSFSNRETIPLTTIFQNIAYANDQEQIVDLIENELPHTIKNYLSLNGTGKTVDEIYRVRGKKDSFSLYPRVVVTDTSEGQLFGNELTIGYWFDEDWKGVNLIIHYMRQVSKYRWNPQEEKERMTSAKEMKELFTALADREFSLSNVMKVSERSKKNHMKYESGVIYCKHYDSFLYFTEEEFKQDLLRTYDMYLKLLDSATKKVQETFENLYQIRREHDRKENPTQSEDSFDITDLNRVLSVPVEPRFCPKIRMKVAKLANYKCEVNEVHETFINGKTGMPYVITRALIPHSYQSEFETSLDVAANYCCLCPMCDAKLTHGTDADRQELLMELYMKHKDGLQKAGINITLMQLFKYHGMN